MAFTHSIRNPVFGVSTVPNIARAEGFCEKQDNWSNNATVGIVRRSSAALTHMPAVRSDIVAILAIESFKVDSTYRTLMLLHLDTGDLRLAEWLDNGQIEDKHVGSMPANWLPEHEYMMYYINDNIYILNSSIDVVANDSGRYDYGYVTANVIIPLAIGYSETVQAKVNYVDANGATTLLKDWVTYTSIAYNGNNQDAADASRARDTVTTALAGLIAGTYTSPLGNGTQSFIVTHVSGSICVQLSNADRTSNVRNGFIQVEVQSSSLGSVALDTDSIKAFNPVIQATEGLPKYSVLTAWKKVQPNPAVSTGTYFLKPQPVTGASTLNTMHEVAWVETYDYAGTKSFDLNTVPQVYNLEKETVGALQLKDRPAGDDETNKQPYFIGAKITSMCGAQERVGFGVKDKVWWSKTDDEKQVWRTSAAQVLSTDAFGIGNAGVTTAFKQIIHHNRALLFIGEEQQAKVDNTSAITNGSTTLAITTSSSVDTSVKPIAVGSDVYMATRVAHSAGILRYFAATNRETDDTEDVTEHIRGYITGNIKQLHGNDNASTLVVQATEANNGVIYVCNIDTTSSSEKVVHAWSRWIIEGVDILNLLVTQYSVQVFGTYELNGVRYYIKYEIPIFYSQLDTTGKVCLDHRLTYTVAADGDTIELPEGYPEGDVIVTPIDGAYPYISEYNIRTGNTVMFNSKAGVTYMVGFRFSSMMVLSTIYRYSDEGMPLLNDRLRIKSIALHMAEMYRITRKLITKYDEFDIDDEEMVTESYANMSELFNLQKFEGSYEFSVGMNTTDCNVAFECDYELMGVITGMTYKAMLHNSER